MTSREIVNIVQYLMSGDIGNINLGFEICLQSDSEYLRNLPFKVKDKLVKLSNFYEEMELEYEDRIKDYELYAGAYSEEQTWGKSHEEVDGRELYRMASYWEKKSAEMSENLDKFIWAFLPKMQNHPTVQNALNNIDIIQQ